MPIPRELDYSLDAPRVPSGTFALEQQIAPIGGGNSFSILNSGVVSVFDVPNMGSMDKYSLYVKYKATPQHNGAAVGAALGAAGVAAQVRGCPAYTMMKQLDITVGSSALESLAEYGRYQNFRVNTTMNVAQKLGNPGLGYATSLGVTTPSSLDGRFSPVGDVMSLSAPLDCCLTNTEGPSLIPLWALSGTKVAITWESLINIFNPAAVEILSTTAAVQGNGVVPTPATAVPTDLIISDVFLCFTLLQFPQEIDNTIRQMYAKDKLVLKSQSYSIQTNGVTANTSGSIDMSFAHRQTSIRAVFLMMQATGSTNGQLDSFDITTGGTAAVQPVQNAANAVVTAAANAIILGGGEYSIMIAGKSYPQRPHATSVAGKLAMFMELRKCLGSLYDRSNNISITAQEWSKNLTPIAAQDVRYHASTAIDPAKFYPAFRTQLLQSNSVFLSGVSAQDSAIQAKIVIGTPTATACSVSCVSCFDLMIEIDVNSKTARSVV